MGRSIKKSLGSSTPLVLILIMAASLISACSLSTDDMVPTSLGSSGWTSAHSIHVAPVVSGLDNKESTFGGAAMVEPDQLKSAIILALKRAAIFKDASADSGDLDLYATIRSQTQDGGLFPYTARILISYRFVDHSGSAIWSASYESAGSSNAFAGATRTLNAREASVRANLASLIEGIQQNWPAQYR